jgi:nitrate reductase alpha subunit
MNLEVGNLSVAPSRAHHASKAVTSAASRAGETIGSISFHANGQVTVESIQGHLTILNQDHQVLAALSSKDSITIPSVRSDAVKVAQADDEVISEKAEKKGLSTWAWVGIGAGVVAVVALALALGGGGGGGGDHDAPVCP